MFAIGFWVRKIDCLLDRLVTSNPFTSPWSQTDRSSRFFKSQELLLIDWSEAVCSIFKTRTREKRTLKESQHTTAWFRKPVFTPKPHRRINKSFVGDQKSKQHDIFFALCIQRLLLAEKIYSKHNDGAWLCSSDEQQKTFPNKGLEPQAVWIDFSFHKVLCRISESFFIHKTLSKRFVCSPSNTWHRRASHQSKETNFPS